MFKKQCIIFVDDSDILRLFFKIYFKKNFRKYKLYTFADFESLEQNLKLINNCKLLIFDYSISGAKKYKTAIDFLENHKIDKNIILFTGNDSLYLENKNFDYYFTEIIYKSDELLSEVYKKLKKYL